MKKNFSVAFFLLLALVAYSQKPGSVQKRALIIAIGNYPAAGGWPVISSLHDTMYMRHVLMNQGFPADNVRVVADQAATMEGVRNAFEQLIKDCTKGDIVVIHFSSHGEQVEADNDNKIDGFDECVVTYNAVSPLVSKNYRKDQAEYLRGHTIGSYLARLRQKLGKNGDLIVFMDNCHSGDGTRGVAAVRGGSLPFVSPDFDPRRHKKSDSSLIYKEALLAGTDESNMSGYEVISATRPEELDIETYDDAAKLPVGSLTYAISKSLEDLREGTVYPTYRAFFARIQTIMNVKVPNQHPLLEGNGRDRLLFGGKFVHQMPFVEISAFDRESKEVVLKQGLMDGLDTGATVALYPAGTTDTAKAKPLAAGKIIQSGNFSSTALLDKDPGVQAPAEGWVFIRDRVYRVEPVTFQLLPATVKSAGHGFSGKEIQEVKRSVAGLPFAKYSDHGDLLIVHGILADSLKRSSNGALFATVRNIQQDSQAFADRLEEYARYKFLTSLTSTVPDVNVDVRLIPVIKGVIDTSKTGNSAGGMFEVRDRDSITLKIRNTGAKDVYVNILDIQPDGKINAILPCSSQGIYPQDLKILAGQEYLFPKKYFIRIGPPFGTEVFKIFASESEINVENIATSRGGGSKNLMTAMEKLITSSYTLSRGGEVNSFGNADATTSEFVFLIKPKK